MKFLGIFAVAVIATALPGASPGDARSAQRKLDTLKANRLPPGSTVLFTPGEINSWINVQAKLLALQGVSDLHLALENGHITGFVQIDFLQLKQGATGEAPGWLAKYLLSGKRPVSVAVRFESRDRKARVDVERVEVGGVPIAGAALDFLIHNYLMPEFPQAKVDEWFELDWRINHIAVGPPGASVYIGRY